MSVAREHFFQILPKPDTGLINAFLKKLNSLIGTLLLLAFISLTVFAVYHLSQPNTLPIKKVHVAGEFLHLSPSRLKTLVTDEVRGGFFSVNVAEVGNVLLDAPWVEHVSVSRIWPDTLRVHVKERVAVVRWGDDALLNAEAVHFVPPPATIPKDLPVLYGPDNSYQLMLNRFNELQTIMNKIDLHITSLTMNERRAWKFTLSSGLEVVIGRMEFESRVKRFAEVVVNAMSGQMDKIKKIDMRYTNGFAIEWINSEPIPAGENFDG